MKLKKVHNVQENNLNNFPFGDEDRFKCCKFCRYFNQGKCYNEQVISSYLRYSDVYEISESGVLSGVIEESINSCNRRGMLSELTDLLREWRISEKRVKEFEKKFNEELDDWFNSSLNYEIESAVSNLYQTRLDSVDLLEGVIISDPSHHCCKEFM